MISSVATTRCNILWSKFSNKCLRVVACFVGIYGAITCNLKSYMDYFIRHPSGSRVPMRQDPWTSLRDQRTMLYEIFELYETVGPLLHGLCAPYLKLKIELTKLQAGNW